MSLSQMQVFQEYLQPVIGETLTQMLALFNEASAGALVVRDDGFVGDFLQFSSYTDTTFSGSIRRVNRHAPLSPAWEGYGPGGGFPYDLMQSNEVAVKVAGGFGPIRFEPGQLAWLENPTVEAIAVASQCFAEAMLRDQVNTAIAALCAAIGGVAGLTNDVSGAVGISYVLDPV